MRSGLVFEAMKHVSNRFLLVNAASKATRKLHRLNSRIQETMNDVFAYCRHADPIAGESDDELARLFPRAA